MKSRTIKYLIAGIILNLFTASFLYAQHVDSASITEYSIKHKKFSRPEERGKSLMNEPINNLFDSLKLSKNTFQLRKIAKELGDRYILNKIVLTESQSIIIDKSVTLYLNNTNSESSKTREEAKQQIERLWQLAVPTLLKNLENNNPAISELAAKSLILMRNEEIIKGIIDQANKTNDIKQRKRYVFILSKMQEQRASLVPDRKCLNEEESKKLYANLVLPAIEKLNK